MLTVKAILSGWLLLVILVPPLQSCTLWGFNPLGGRTVDSHDLISEAAADQLAHLQLQGGSGSNWPWCNDSGWGVAAYRVGQGGELPPNQVWRGAGPAYGDTLFDSLETLLLNSGYDAHQLIAHTRTASSGASGVPNPHPFIARLPGSDLAFVHNGTLGKNSLRELIGEEWLQEHPPQTWLEDDWNTEAGWDRVVDSELYFFWLLRNIEEMGGDLSAGLQQALHLMRHLSGDRNFLLTDGADIYAYRGTGPSGATPTPPELWFQTGSNYTGEPLYHAVTTLPADTDCDNWMEVDSDMLVILPVTGEARIQSGFSQEPPVTLQISDLVVSSFPNPFAGSTTFRWESRSSGELRIVVYDLLGRQVRELYHGQTGQGTGTLLWDGCGQGGSSLASGCYILSATLNGERVSQRVMMLK